MVLRKEVLATRHRRWPRFAVPLIFVLASAGGAALAARHYLTPSLRVHGVRQYLIPSTRVQAARPLLACTPLSFRSTVSRSAIQEWTSAPAVRPFRVVRAVQSGMTTGYRVYGIRPGTLAAMAGLRNGDLIKSHTDRELLSLFNRDMPARVHLYLLRSGCPVSLSLTVI